jgi:hypothetical protein
LMTSFFRTSKPTNRLIYPEKFSDIHPKGETIIHPQNL